ncbi:MAG: hypothetical protein JJE19_00910 [Methanosarcinales archaeon]|nr:hypothetical protein [Methanosarcinales archaeon]
MLDKVIVIKGLEWIINHKEMLYQRNKDFEDNELGLLNNMSLVMDRALIINKSGEWSVITLMLNVLYNQLSACWEYMTEDEWKIFMDRIVTELSNWKAAVESDDKKALYESVIFTITYTGNANVEAMFSGKRKTTPEEWQIEKTMDERIEKVESDIAAMEDILNRQRFGIQLFSDHIAKIETDISEIERRILE